MAVFDEIRINELFEPSPASMPIVDPVLKDYGPVWIGMDHIEPTKALRRWMGRVPFRPSLCVLHHQGECNVGSKCNQAHVDPWFLALVRHALLGHPFINCCKAHGDLPSQRSDFRTALWQRTVYLKAGTRLTAIAPEILAVTAYFECYLADPSKLPACGRPVLLDCSRVCKLHQRQECKYGPDCRNVHVCREFWASLPAEAREVSATPVVMRRHYSGVPIEAPVQLDGLVAVVVAANPSRSPLADRPQPGPARPTVPGRPPAILDKAVPLPAPSGASRPPPSFAVRAGIPPLLPPGPQHPLVRLKGDPPASALDVVRHVSCGGSPSDRGDTLPPGSIHPSPTTPADVWAAVASSAIHDGNPRPTVQEPQAPGSPAEAPLIAPKVDPNSGSALCPSDLIILQELMMNICHDDPTSLSKDTSINTPKPLASAQEQPHQSGGTDSIGGGPLELATQRTMLQHLMICLLDDAAAGVALPWHIIYGVVDDLRAAFQ